MFPLHSLIGALLLVGLSLTSLGPVAHAHGKSVSYSHWRLIPDGAEVSVRIPLLELSRLGVPLPLTGAGGARSDPGPVGNYLVRHLQLSSAEGPCAPKRAPVFHEGKQGWVRYSWSVRCPSSGERTIESQILLNPAPSHLHFARITTPPVEAGEPPRMLERVLTEATPRWNLEPTGQTPAEPSEASGSSFVSYLQLGVEHILSGWDHLAFVFALVLLARTLGEVARLVTGFTVAHSITLALAVLGWVEPRSGPVEAVIGFSVALIAAENAWILGGRGNAVPQLTVLGLLLMAVLALLGWGTLPALTLMGLAVFSASHFGLLKRAADPGLHRIVLAFAFGLVHGFGFAGVLAEMELPAHRLAPALLGFNLGVEVGQLAVVALIWPLLLLLKRVRKGQPHRLFAELSSAAICGFGLYWFLDRTFA